MKYEFHDGPLDGCVMNFPRDISEIIIGTPCKMEGDKPDHYTGVYLRRYFDFGDGYMGLAGDTTMSVQDINYTFSESKPMNKKRLIDFVVFPFLRSKDEQTIERIMLTGKPELLHATVNEMGDVFVFFESDTPCNDEQGVMYDFVMIDTMKEYDDEQNSNLSYMTTLCFEGTYRHLVTGLTEF